MQIEQKTPKYQSTRFLQLLRCSHSCFVSNTPEPYWILDKFPDLLYFICCVALSHTASL